MPEQEFKTQPLISDIRRMWQEINLTQIETPSEVRQLVDLLRAGRGNGGAEFAMFSFESHPVLRWYMRGLQLVPPHFDFASEFVVQPAVREAMKAIGIPEKLEKPLQVGQFGCFSLEAELNSNLLSGGAYRRFEGSREEARNLVALAMNELEQEPFFELWVGFTSQPWTEWFCDVAWDRTYIGLNRTTNRAWILCLTDTD